MTDSPIVGRIWLTTAVLLLVQIAVALFVSTVYQFSLLERRWFLVALPIWHVVIAASLARLSYLFTDESGRQLQRVNVANVLSMIRLSSSPTLLWLVLLADTYPVGPVVVPLTAIVFLTDLLDGQISRRTGSVTQIGKYLDSSSDYTVLFIVSIALVNYKLLQLWLFLVILARLVLQWLGQITLFLVRGRSLTFRTSFLGKASVFAIMTLFAVSLIGLIEDLPRWFSVFLTLLQYVTAVIAIVSLIEKMIIFVSDLRSASGSKTRLSE
ncbi:MAG: CDP-alcohol phosphatidyltransferase family protein [Spirochaetales bacterium]